jgi:hypothetical protein
MCRVSLAEVGVCEAVQRMKFSIDLVFRVMYLKTLGITGVKGVCRGAGL